MTKCGCYSPNKIRREIEHEMTFEPDVDVDGSPAVSRGCKECVVVDLKGWVDPKPSLII